VTEDSRTRVRSRWEALQIFADLHQSVVAARISACALQRNSTLVGRVTTSLLHSRRDVIDAHRQTCPPALMACRFVAVIIQAISTGHGTRKDAALRQ
jgi:hypothetical protein